MHRIKLEKTNAENKPITLRKVKNRFQTLYLAVTRRSHFRATDTPGP
jgi:hypothetical protein